MIRQLRSDGLTSQDIDQRMGWSKGRTSAFIIHHMPDLKHTTEKEQQLIRQLRGEGLKNVEIDRRMGWPKHRTTHLIHQHMPDLQQQQTNMAKTMTDQDADEMVRLFKDEHASITRISRKFGISTDAVRNRLVDRLGEAEVARLIGLYTKPPWPWTQELKAFVVQQYTSGVSPITIAAVIAREQGPGTEPMTSVVVNNMLSNLPNYQELRAEFRANHGLSRQPGQATTRVTRAGKIDPGGRRADWRRGRGYK